VSAEIAARAVLRGRRERRSARLEVAQDEVLQLSAHLRRRTRLRQEAREAALETERREVDASFEQTAVRQVAARRRALRLVGPRRRNARVADRPASVVATARHAIPERPDEV